MSVEGNALSIVPTHEEGRGRTQRLSECVSEDLEAVGSVVYPASAKSNAGYSADTDDFGDLKHPFVMAHCSTVEIPVLPGRGETGPGCGLQVPYHCNDCGGSFFVTSSCMRRECPDCYEKWAWKEARVASWRMWTGAKLRVRNHGWNGMERVPGEEPWAWRDCRVLHTVVSIPDRGQGIEVSRAQARAIAKKHNLDGGLMVYHPFDKPGFIKYHVIALAHGDVLPGGTDGDIVFKVLPDAEGHDYRGFRGPVGVRRALHYLLSHAGIIQGRHALTWWGSLAYRNFPDRVFKDSYPEAWEEIHDTRVRCPLCGSRNTEPDETPQDIGWPSKRPVHYAFGSHPPWGT